MLVVDSLMKRKYKFALIKIIIIYVDFNDSIIAYKYWNMNSSLWRHETWFILLCLEEKIRLVPNFCSVVYIYIYIYISK